MINKKLLSPYFLVPLLVLGCLLFFLWKALDLNPQYFNQSRLEKTLPKFQLPYLFNNQSTANESIFKQRVSLLVIWASWCRGCQDEHAEIIKISKELPELLLIGVNFHDHPKQAAEFLALHENPFHHALLDKDGIFSLDLGVTGLPELFLIDKKGVVRYQHLGQMNTSTWLMIIRPKVMELLAEQ